MSQRKVWITEEEGQEIINRLNVLCPIAAAQQVVSIVKILQDADQRSKPVEEKQ